MYSMLLCRGAGSLPTEGTDSRLLLELALHERLDVMVQLLF